MVPDKIQGINQIMSLSDHNGPGLLEAGGWIPGPGGRVTRFKVLLPDHGSQRSSEI